MSQYLALALSLTAYQLLRTLQAVIEYKLLTRADRYVKTRIYVTLAVGLALMWVPVFQLFAAYSVLIYYVAAFICNAIADVFPKSYVAQLRRAKNAGKEMYLDMIHRDNLEIAEAQVLDGCC